MQQAHTLEEVFCSEEKVNNWVGERRVLLGRITKVWWEGQVH
jgi:hypothetical protein